MSIAVFGVALVVSAALVALWLDARVPKLATAQLQTIVGHAILAILLLNLVPAAGETILGTWLVLFGALLPALVYAFSVAIWSIRMWQGAAASLR
jgi:hypothetical protein